MRSNTIGNVTQSVLSERELRLLWEGLKALKEFGASDKCVGLRDDSEILELLTDVTKACNQHLDTHGPMSDAEIKHHIERQKWLAHLRDIDPEMQAKIALAGKEAKIRRKKEKLENERKRRRMTHFTHGQDIRCFATTRENYQTERRQKELEKKWLEQDDWTKELKKWRKK